MPILVNVAENQLKQRFAFDKQPIIIGRLQKSDVVVRDHQVSRQHARIAFEDERYVIEDLQSTNYVYVNQQQVGKVAVNHGDVINIGGVADYIFLLHEDDALCQRILEGIRTNPDCSPESYRLKKTMTDLVDELSHSKVIRPSDPDHPESMRSTFEDVEALYEIAYSINSTLELEQVLTLIITKVLKVVQGERGFIMLRDETTGELEVKVARTVNEKLSGAERETYSSTIARKAIEAGETYFSTNAKEDPLMSTHSIINYCIREVMCAPLKVRRDTIGVIYVDTRQVKGGFDRRHILLFQAISHQASLAIFNARLTEELRDKSKKLELAYEELKDRATRLQIVNEKLDQKVAELSALNAVSKGINMVSDLNSVLKLILQKTVELLGAERGSLMLCDEDTQTMRVEVVHGIESPDEKRITLKMGEGVAGLCLRQGVPIAVADGHKNDKFKMLLPRDTKIRSLMCVPLILNARKIGVINVTNKLAGAGFTESDKSLAMTLANQAAITIENARLYNLAIYDGLTNLHVHRYFQVWLQKEFERTNRYGGVLSLVMLDIDNFKSINDTYGHQFGDLILQEVAAIVRQSVRSVDLAARYGGEEFAIILPETEPPGAEMFAERLRSKVAAQSFAYQEKELGVTVSLGIGTFQDENVSSKEQLIQMADSALYRAKRTGKNKYCFFDAEMDEM